MGSEGGSSSRSRTAALTRREREAVELLCLGLSNAEIGQRMGIGLSTTKNYLSSVYRKIGASNRTEAVVMWTRKRWTGWREAG